VARLIDVRPGKVAGPDYRKAIAGAAAIIRGGGLVGFPTDTVYGLAADALNKVAVARVFEVKGRPRDSALILHLSRAEQAWRYAAGVPPVARRLMDDFWPGALTLVMKKAPVVPAITAGGRDSVALRIPAHPVALDFIRECGGPVVGPSANRSGRPSPVTPADVLDELGDDIDAVLDAGPAPLGMESTVLDLTAVPPALLRPGPVTAESLSPYLEELASPLPGASGAGRGAESPGISVPLVLAGLEPGGEAAARLWRLAGEALAAGRRPGLLLTSEGRDAGAAGRGMVTFVLGPRADLAGIAARLYAGLRALEAQGCDVIFAEPVGCSGLGAAVMDRLRRAAREVVLE